jgi:hypothetical protein
MLLAQQAVLPASRTPCYRVGWIRRPAGLIQGLMPSGGVVFHPDCHWFPPSTICLLGASASPHPEVKGRGNRPHGPRLGCGRRHEKLSAPTLYLATWPVQQNIFPASRRSRSCRLATAARKKAAGSREETDRRPETGTRGWRLFDSPKRHIIGESFGELRLDLVMKAAGQPIRGISEYGSPVWREGSHAKIFECEIPHFPSSSYKI